MVSLKTMTTKVQRIPVEIFAPIMAIMAIQWMFVIGNMDFLLGTNCMVERAILSET